MLIPMQYLGEGQFQAPKRFAKSCDAQLVIGEQHCWEIVHERSSASHRHFFALCAEAWANLPENLAADFPNPETLRKWALIKAGYCDTTKLVCADNKEALRAAVIMKAMDAFALCEASGRVVTVYRAQSQSVRAMGAAEFQKSKDAVLAEIGKLIGADPAELGKAA